MGRGPSTEYHKNMMDGYSKGTLTCLSSKYIKANINTDFPLVLNIEPTNNCNLRCYLCPRNNNIRKVGNMDFDLFTRIIDECGKHKKLKMINFHKDGESLLHPRIFDMIRYAADSGTAEILHMNTNAVELGKEKAERFLMCGIDDVTMSVDAARPETFKKVKGADLLEKVESNIRNVMKLKKAMGLDKPFIRVKIMEFDDLPRDEINEFVDRWKDVADDVQITGVHSWSGAIKGLKVTDEVKEKRYPCILLWYMLAVNWDGKVSACNVDWDLSALVGDMKDSTIHDIWNGAKLKKLREAELKGDHAVAKVCKECVVWAGGEDLTDYFLTRKEFYT